MSVSISVNGAEVMAAFDVTSKRTFNAVVDAVEGGTVELRDLWRELATASSGKHGKHYPKAIEHEILKRLGYIEGQVAPNPAKPQGGMSFEDGSRNQPPHPDSVTATTVMEPRIVKRIDAALGRALG